MMLKLRTLIAATLVTGALGSLAGYEMARRSDASNALAPTPDATLQRKVLYWYDPMEPAQHFDKPGKSPFMDMQMVPRYADEGSGEASGVRVDPRMAQNLGIRLATVERSEVSQSLEVPGTVVFDERLTATVQARTAGFVSRTYARAPGDMVGPHEALVDLLVPDWAAAQTEYLSLVSTGDASLIFAARQRLVLLGMPASLIARVEQSRQVNTEVTIVSPIAGAIDTLDVRAGMAVNAGATLAKIQGLDPIWIEATIPQALGALAGLAKVATIGCTAYPGNPFHGRVVSVLPQTNADSHTLRVRIEIANPKRQLKPGMFAQVQLGTGDPRPALLVPSEAVIHTGTRDLVIVESTPHRFEPIAVQIGAQYGARTSIVSGLAEGQTVVASGQFLIDSEASLRGIAVRMGERGGTP
jgi:Cu(I)/Ag(I) efflux system membrane fusion protein